MEIRKERSRDSKARNDLKPMRFDFSSVRLILDYLLTVGIL